MQNPLVQQVKTLFPATVQFKDIILREHIPTTSNGARIWFIAVRPDTNIWAFLRGDNLKHVVTSIFDGAGDC
jgi:hypothetical protein